MPPTLQKIVLDGASRHRLSKGFILAGGPAGRAPSAEAREKVVREANEVVARTGLRGFAVVSRPSHASLVGLDTPLLPVYDRARRDSFVYKLASAAGCLSAAASRAGFRLVGAGVNPYEGDSSGKPAALCADLHQVEIYDDGEVERIYNLYRQYLPELLASSSNSAVYASEPQKDFSVRMRINPSSFLPRYLSQFATEHLRRLERTVRRAYGIADLRQMDINPLGGDASVLAAGETGQSPTRLLGEAAAAVELRFIDAQCSYAFIRAQIILLQAIAMYGRSLARQGRRLPYMRDEVIDENKALAIQSGSLAILKPDPTFKKDEGRRGLWFHDRGTTERAPTSLLSIIEERLLPPLRDLECTPEELSPLVLGAELRRRGKRCLVSYGEYQQYVFYTSGRDFAAAYQQQLEALHSQVAKDYLSEYNRRTYPEVAAEVEREWARKLAPPHPAPAPPPRVRGRVRWFDAEKGFGSIDADAGDAIFVHQEEVEGGAALRPGQAVSFEVAQGAKGRRARHVRGEREG